MHNNSSRTLPIINSERTYVHVYVCVCAYNLFINLQISVIPELIFYSICSLKNCYYCSCSKLCQHTPLHSEIIEEAFIYCHHSITLTELLTLVVFLERDLSNLG